MYSEFLNRTMKERLKGGSMKKLKSVMGLFTLLLVVFSATISSISASAATEQEEISSMIQEHVDKAKIPSVSTGMIRGDNVSFLSKGSQTADQNTLYTIGSTSKAFTALSILWLEDEGLLSLDDSVAKHLPWFKVKYDGKNVPDEDLSIANLVYQTSGFTNDESKFPTAKAEMTLEEYGHTFAGAELVSYPSDQYAYANANYVLLGLLIETITGKSYAEFTKEVIFEPLGLQSTSADPEKITKKDAIIQGSRLSFFMTHPYEVAIKPALIPTGYIISSTKDISRWLQIQLGTIEVEPQMKRLITKSHQPDKAHRVDEETRYAAGWFVVEDGTIQHSGGTPNYSTNFIIKPDANIGVCVLTNTNATVNTNMMAENIINIMDGDPISPYKPDIWVTMDKIFSIMTFVCVPLLIGTLVMIFRIKKQSCTGIRIKKVQKKRITKFIVLPVVLLILAIAMLIVFPITFSSGWLALSTWAPYSMYTGIGAFTVLSGLLIAAAYMVSIYPKNQ